MDRLEAATSATPQLRAVLDTLRAISSRQGGVLLRGELASGRETLARALHEHARPSQPFVIVDIAAIPSPLLESVLFGHQYTTFTGSHVVKRGVFETVESGTVLLREVAAIPIDLQPKMLHVLRRREYRRFGSDVTRPFHGRVISTTHCAMEELVAARWFQPELLAAIAKDADLVVPSLRERSADLPALLRRVAPSLDGALVARLSRLAWRGNFRDLDAFARALASARAIDVVTELELLQAIEESPDDDNPRLVYGDLLAARGDPRGELVQLQCKLAAGSPDRKVRAAARTLLETHHKIWERPVIEVASTPAVASQATFERGFVHALTIDADVLRRFDVVVRAAPLLSRVSCQGELGSPIWISPQLRRLRDLEVALPTLGAPPIHDLVRCPYLTGLRSLTLTSGHVVATHDDPELRQVGIEALATSPHLANVTTLRLRQYELSADNLAMLLGDRASWRLSALGLLDAALVPEVMTALVTAPGASGLRELDLKGSPIRLAAARVLAGAGSLANLTTLRMSQIDDDAREILLASPALCGVTLLDGSQQMIRPGG